MPKLGGACACPWDGWLRRLNHPQLVEGSVVMAVATVGILVNGVTAWLFARGRKALSISATALMIGGRQLPREL